MTTPSPNPSSSDNRLPKPNSPAGAKGITAQPSDGHPSDGRPSISEADRETRRIPADDTPRFSELQSTATELPEELSEDERLQATAALGFLDDVRTAVRESQRNSAELPQAIGRYTVVRSIGRGGFAEVFLAVDTELDRQVALKVPLFHADRNPDARQRFEREGKLAAALGHPQIVPVYEYGEVGPVRFIAFAWVDGMSLADWMASQNTVDFRTAAKIIAHLADAVQHAHQRGVIHRDLKPGNVLIAHGKDPEDKPIWKRVLITDFGLARRTGLGDATLTQDGQIVGTPAYMAPEQASSESRQTEQSVGPAADVWALGMILYEMVTGITPFRRDELIQTLRAITDDPLPNPRKHRSDTPSALSAIIECCLQKEPSLRYASAHDLAADLNRWLLNEPVEAKRLSLFSKTVLWCKRNPLVTAATAAAIVFLGTGMGIALWQRDAAIKNLRAAQTQTSRADGNLDTAQTLINEIVNLEKKLRQQSRLAPERNALVKLAAQLQLELVQDEAPTVRVRYSTASTLKELSNLLVQLGDYEAGMESASQVIKLLEGIEDNDLPEGIAYADVFAIRFEQRLRLSSALSLSGRFDEALSLYKANQSEPAPKSMDPHRAAIIFAENSRALSGLYQMQGDRTKSVGVLQTALERFDRINEPESKKQIWDLHLTKCRIGTSLTSDLAELNQLELAEACFLAASESLPVLDSIFPDHPVLAQTRSVLAWQGGVLFEKLEEHKKAIEQYASCRRLNRELYEQNPAVLNSANIYVLASLALARSHAAANDPETAALVAEETLQLAQSFPDSLQNDAAFGDNSRLLKVYAAE